MLDYPVGIAIKEIINENANVKTFVLDAHLEARPGQFIMVWVPRIDEKPFSLSKISGDIAITVQKKGKATEKMHEMRAVEILGIRGPYGNGFDAGRAKSACIVAGGIGAAPLVPLAEALQNSTFILGARTKNDLLFEDRLRKCSELYITTDDGSAGEKGFNTQVLEKLLAGGKKFDAVFCCGPEPMMRHVFEICEKHRIPLQASLERFMKCGGLGICGQCSVNGIRVCADGPVFGNEMLGKMLEFGISARLKTGKSVPLKEYAEWRQK